MFPVHVDIPITTGLAAIKAGLFGSVSSCAPDRTAALTAMVVGTQGACVYHGQAFFNVASLLPGTPIQSATLNLYTPSQTEPTDVVYPNTPPSPTELYAPSPLQAPSWNTALPPTPGSAGIAQSGSAGHWQQWDLTALVQNWVNDRRLEQTVK